MSTDWNVSCCVRSTAPKKCALSCDDRAAEAAAELVAAIVLLVDFVELLGFGLRVHLRVAEQLEEAALQLVRAALGDDVHHAAVAAAVLGLVALRDEVELLDRLEREELQQAADGVVVVVAAVDLVVEVAAVAARDLRRVLRALGRVGVEAEADARDRRRQIRELPAVERQALDRPMSTTPPTDEDCRLDQRRFAGDGDRFATPATFSRCSRRSSGRR